LDIAERGMGVAELIAVRPWNRGMGVAVLIAFRP
jgi:hypothetical protein